MIEKNTPQALVEQSITKTKIKKEKKSIKYSEKPIASNTSFSGKKARAEFKSLAKKN